MPSPDQMREYARELRSKARLYSEQATALEREARVIELSEGLDHLGVPRTAGRPWIIRTLRDRGWTLDNNLASEIAKYRREQQRQEQPR